MDSRNIEHWFNNREVSVTDEPLILESIVETIEELVASNDKEGLMTKEQIQAGKFLALAAGSGNAERHLAEKLGISADQIIMVDQQRVDAVEGETRITSDLFAFLKDTSVHGVDLAEVSFVTALGAEYVLEGENVRKVADGLHSGLGSALVCVFPDLSDKSEIQMWRDNGFKPLRRPGYYYHEGAAEITP